MPLARGIRPSGRGMRQRVSEGSTHFMRAIPASAIEFRPRRVAVFATPMRRNAHLRLPWFAHAGPRCPSSSSPTGSGVCKGSVVATQSTILRGRLIDHRGVSSWTQYVPRVPSRMRLAGERRASTWVRRAPPRRAASCPPHDHKRVGDGTSARTRAALGLRAGGHRDRGRPRVGGPCARSLSRPSPPGLRGLPFRGGPLRGLMIENGARAFSSTRALRRLA